MLAKVIFVVLLPFCLTKSADVTFKNVVFRGFSSYREKFKKTIPLSNSLKEFLPNSAFDRIEFTNQHIPALYENSLADLDDLDELVIENCDVTEIEPGALKNVPLLRRLSLHGNKLKGIKEGVFNGLQLSTIDLSLNHITTIDSNAFDNMPNLRNINLADNNIEQWNKHWFKNTPLLKKVSMLNNSITIIPNNAFKNLAASRKFGKIKLTLNLVFSHNKIKTIQPDAFRDLTEITDLWLDNNKIQCLDGDLSQIIKAVTTHLDSNPYDCECLIKIKEWAKQNDKNVDLFFSEMDCAAERIKLKLTNLEKD